MTPTELYGHIMFQCAFIAPESWDVYEGKINHGIRILERELDACFCDDGRGDPECSTCTERRSVIEKLRAQLRHS